MAPVGRRPQSHSEATGQRLSPRLQAFAPGCVRADRRSDAPVPGPPTWSQGRYPRWRRAPRGLLLRPPSRPELRCQLEKLGSSRLPVCLARLPGECSWQTNIGNDVGVEPTTLDLASYCFTINLFVWVSPEA